MIEPVGKVLAMRKKKLVESLVGSFNQLLTLTNSLRSPKEEEKEEEVEKKI